MIIPRPMGILRTALFFPSFIVARVPFWFIIASIILTKDFKLSYVVAVVVAIFLARSFIESELASGGFILFSFARIARFFTVIIGAILLDIFFLFYIFSSPIDKALLSLLLIILTLLFFDTERSRGYWEGYTLPLTVRIVLIILWAYLLLVPDTIFGASTVLGAIYLIEFYNLYTKEVISGLEVFRSHD